MNVKHLNFSCYNTLYSILQETIVLNLILVDLEYNATRKKSVANVQYLMLPITVFNVRIMLMYTCIYISNILFSRTMFNGTYWLTSK